MAAKEITKKRKATASDASAPKKQKKTEKTTVVATGPLKTALSKGTVSRDKPSKTLPTVKGTAKGKPSQHATDAFDEEESELEILADDQTADLLKGFEDSDEDEGAEGGAPIDAVTIAEKDIPGVPVSATSALAKRVEKKDDDAAATLYIGRIPHGFYEPQMRAYFSQFGEISHMRLSRNKRTGASKHYAFLEFASGQVARIVADTMNNYLLFNHILKVKVLTEDQITKMGPALWAGEGKRFKVMPWGGIERGNLKSADRETWTKRVSKEQKRRNARASKLKELGYEFEAPQMVQVDSVAVQTAPVLPPDAPTATLSNSDVPKKQIEASKDDANVIDSLISAPKSKSTQKPAAASAEKVRKGKKSMSTENGIATKAAAEAVHNKKTKRKVSSMI